MSGGIVKRFSIGFCLLLLSASFAEIVAKPKSSCSSLLFSLTSSEEAFNHSSTDFVVQEISDGLWVPADKMANQHVSESEMSSSINYASYLYTQQGKSMLLLADFDGFSIPSFDGVIFDSQTNAELNLQLKHLGFKSVKMAIKKAVEKIERSTREYSYWSYLLRNHKHSEYWLRKMRYVLGLSKDKNNLRPSQIVIDLKYYPSEAALRNLFHQIQAEFSSYTELIHSVVLMTDDRIVTINSSSIQVSYWQRVSEMFLTRSSIKKAG